MIRDITIGQYYPADSVIHKLDPRTKLVGTIGFIVSVFLFHTFAGYAVATIFLAGMILLSKVPVKFIFKGLKTIFMLLLITIFFNMILTPGEVIWKLGFIKVTKEGLVLAGTMAIRSCCILAITFFRFVCSGTHGRENNIACDQNTNDQCRIFLSIIKSRNVNVGCKYIQERFVLDRYCLIIQYQTSKSTENEHAGKCCDKWRNSLITNPVALPYTNQKADYKAKKNGKEWIKSFAANQDSCNTTYKTDNRSNRKIDVTTS